MIYYAPGIYFTWCKIRKILQLLNKWINDKPHWSNVRLKEEIEELGC